MAALPGNLPESLPPEGIDIGYKYLIYLGLIYIIATAIFSWLITRRRFKSFDDEYEDDYDRITGTDVQIGIRQTLTFDDTRDILSGLKIEIAGAEASLTKLNSERELGEISEEAFLSLSERYNNHVNDISKKMNEMIKSSIQSTTGSIDEGINIDYSISEEEMAGIEADLQKQLLDLETDDDFLKPKVRPKVPVSDPLAAPKRSKQSAPIPPPPAKVSKTKASAPIQPPTKVSKSRAPAPAPTPMQPQSIPKKVSKPPAPVKPDSKAPAPAAQPKSRVAKIPAPMKIPDSEHVKPPISAQQPMKVATQEGDEKIFAKSTSIAALRMDMLRELARLKKLIKDEDK